MTKQIITCILSLLLTLPIGAAEPVNVTLLATSDLHGVFTPWDYASDKENLSGSLSQIATKVKEIRATTPHVILIDVGDTTQGNSIETFRDHPINPMIMGLNMLGYDIWVPGNHEFDFGLPVLQHALQQFKGQVLAANINKDDGSAYLPGYKIFDINGIKIAIIGVTTPMTNEFAQASDRIKGITFTDPTQAVKKILTELDGKVDATILVSHMGIDNENKTPNTGNRDIAMVNPQLTAIFAGHMHVKIDQEFIGNVILTEPAKFGEALSRIDLSFEKVDGKVKLISKSSKTYTMKGITPDAEMVTAFAPYHQQLRKAANEPLATLRGINLVPPDAVKGIPQVQIQDTPLVALFQEACLHYVPMADVIAIHIDNDKARMDVGEIRLKDIAYNYSYKGGEISVYQVTGKELKQYMEWAVAYFNQINDGDVTYSFNPKRRSSKYITHDLFGGVTYTVNLRQPEGKRIFNLHLANGQLVTDDTPIRLGMNAYRMAQLTQQGAIFSGQHFPVVFNSKQAYGEEEGTIRLMLARYLTEVKKGQYESKPINRWQLTGLTDYQRERRIVEKLLNQGKISVPVSDDGRFTNIASINVKDKIFKNKISFTNAIKQRQSALLYAENDTDRKRLNDEIMIIKEINYFVY